MKPKKNTLAWLLPHLTPEELRLLEEKVLEVIGDDFTQTERHWSNEDSDWCGHGGTMIDTRCICDELNALKGYQREALNKLIRGEK